MLLCWAQRLMTAVPAILDRVRNGVHKKVCPFNMYCGILFLLNLIAEN